MGHERAASLPATGPWTEVVEGLAGAAESDADLSRLASRTLENVRKRYAHLHEDPGVEAAFQFILALSTAQLAAEQSADLPEVDLSGEPSLLALIGELNQWIDEHSDSVEYAHLAKKSAADTLSAWTRRQSRQRELFSSTTSPQQVWAKASDGAGFCEVSRLFFAAFTRHYLAYFLDREASAELPETDIRDSFGQRLTDHVEDLSQHAFETAKITQSFAAGWFNSRAPTGDVTNEDVENFLSFAFGKLREELKRQEPEG